MDIGRAAVQIKGAVQAYLSTDESGARRIPFHMQRPIIMFGPPGVGKTAIVSQIAEELGINFVAYSITHHTRQSALGLPYITEKTYEGRDYRVSEYTMSEIIGAVHDAIARTGVAEGILFLDEVNCVSETLAPAMLQFLQYKTFGQHRLPEGWVIVTAGNPPEYNRSAREFDPVTMDRMKRIDVEPDVGVWLAYATERRLHPVVVTYLQAKPANFYKVQAAVRGTLMVTARGWEDLSRIIGAYEAEGLAVDVDLVGQYLQDPDIAEDFAVYYELFCKYRDDYKVPEILAGTAGEEVVERAGAAPFDERVVLVDLLVDAVRGRLDASVAYEEALGLVRPLVAEIISRGISPEEASRMLANAADAGAIGAVGAGGAAGAGATAEVKRGRGSVADGAAILARRKAVLERLRRAAQRAGAEGAEDSPEALASALKAAYNNECAGQEGIAASATASLDATLRFLEEAFEDGEETLIFVTKLAQDPACMKHISNHGSEEFFRHSDNLMFSERNLTLLAQVRARDAEL